MTADVNISPVRCALNDFIANSNANYLEEAAIVLSKSKNTTTKSNEMSSKSKLQYSAMIPTFEIFSDDDECVFEEQKQPSLHMIQESYSTVRTISDNFPEVEI